MRGRIIISKAAGRDISSIGVSIVTSCFVLVLIFTCVRLIIRCIPKQWPRQDSHHSHEKMQSKENGNDRESIQSCATPDPGNNIGK